MPCDQIRETTLDMQAANIDLLAKALEAEGHRVHTRGQRHLEFTTKDGYRGVYQNGLIRTNEDSVVARDPNAVKRAYSREVVKATTAKMGWRTRFAEPDTIVATKRRMN